MHVTESCAICKGTEMVQRANDSDSLEDQIKDRKGRMVNGVFVKSSDLKMTNSY